MTTITIFTYVELAAEFLPLPPPPPPSDTYPIAIHYQDAGIYGTDLFVQPFSVGSAGTSTTPVVGGWWVSAEYSADGTSLSHGPPVLDTTWQSFVEQLGDFEE